MLAVQVTLRLQSRLTQYIYLASMFLSNAETFGWATDNSRFQPCGRTLNSASIKNQAYQAP